MYARLAEISQRVLRQMPERRDWCNGYRSRAANLKFLQILMRVIIMTKLPVSKDGPRFDVTLDYRLGRDQWSKLGNRLKNRILKGNILKVDTHPAAYEGLSVSAQDLEFAISQVLRSISEYDGPGQLRRLQIHITQCPGKTEAISPISELELDQQAIAALESVGGL